ncbi:MAG: ExbD/TolR family protein [Prevotella sp.]
MRVIKFRKRKKKRMPVLNTTSTADISFILLIFFLVTTSLDTDKGLVRQLPPMPKEEQNETMKVDDEKVLEIDINANDLVTVDGKPSNQSFLPSQLEKFILKFPTEHVISIHADRESSYETYFNIQNTLVNVYQSLRDKYCREYFGRSFSKCSADDQATAVKAFPQRISEQVDSEYETRQKGGLE